NFLAGLGIAAGPLILVAQVEVTKAGQLDLLALRQGRAHFFEKQIHQLPRLPFVEAELVEQGFRHFSFGQGHDSLAFFSQALIEAPNSRCSVPTTAPTIPSASASARVREVSCKIKPKATLFRPESTPGPRYTSN